MLRNALDNALKLSGAAPVDVELEEGERVVLRIRDRGPGVPPGLRERVFEPFFRLEHDGEPGHGLGLSLIAHIARAHGGAAAFVDVGDGAGGACLRLELPRWTPLGTDAGRHTAAGLDRRGGSR